MPTDPWWVLLLVIVAIGLIWLWHRRRQPRSSPVQRTCSACFRPVPPMTAVVDPDGGDA
jgi:hypothetical protein